jgi:hypothetical protein
VGLERDPLNFVSTTAELPGRKSSGSGLEIREYGHGDTLRWPRDTPLSAKVVTNFADKRRSPRPWSPLLEYTFVPIALQMQVFRAYSWTVTAMYKTCLRYLDCLHPCCSLYPKLWGLNSTHYFMKNGETYKNIHCKARILTQNSCDLYLIWAYGQLKTVRWMQKYPILKSTRALFWFLFRILFIAHRNETQLQIPTPQSDSCGES